MIGLGRPLCWQPDFPRCLLAGEVNEVPRVEERLELAQRGWLSPASPSLAIRALNTMGAQAWFYCQIFCLADGEPVQPDRGLLPALVEYARDEFRAARRMHRAYR